jgi:hypothetical protein
MFDSRLFNQTQGMDSGFGGDDSYNIYDKRLFGDEREKALSRATTKDRQDDEGHYDERSKKRDLQWDREDDTGGDGRGKEREGREGKDHEYRGGREKEGRESRDGREGREGRDGRDGREKESREGRDGREWGENKRQRK